MKIAALQDLEQADPAEGRDIRAKCLWKMSVDMAEALEVNAIDDLSGPVPACTDTQCGHDVGIARAGHLAVPVILRSGDCVFQNLEVTLAGRNGAGGAAQGEIASQFRKYLM